MSKPETAAIQRTDESDRLLQTLVRTGSREDFVALFNYYAPKIKAFMAQAGFQPGDADELAQETMLSVWKAYPRYDPGQASANTWIYTIARNKRIDRLRKNAKPTLDAHDFEAMALPERTQEDIHQDSQIAAHIQEILKKIPAEQSKLIVQSYYRNMTHVEIAEAENLPLGTVKSRLRLALDKFKKAIELDESDV